MPVATAVCVCVPNCKQGSACVTVGWWVCRVCTCVVILGEALTYPPGLSQRPLVLSPAVKGPLSFPQVLGFLSLAEQRLPQS